MPRRWRPDGGPLHSPLQRITKRPAFGKALCTRHAARQEQQIRLFKSISSNRGIGQL